MDKYIGYIRNLTTYFGASVIPMMLSLIANPMVACNMSPEDYAVSGYYQSFSTLIGPIITFYLVHYYMKEYFRCSEERRICIFAVIAKMLIWFSGLVSVFCFVVLYVYLQCFKAGHSLPILPYLAMMVFALPLTGLYSLQLAKYRMEKNTKAFFYLSVGNGLLGVLLIILFVVVIKWGAFGKLLAPLAGNSVIFVYLTLKYKKVWKIQTKPCEFHPIFVFCMPLALSAMLGYFTQGFSTTYLESAGDTTEYGIYIVGTSIGSYLTVFATAIGNTFQPDLYETVIKRQWKRYTMFCLAKVILIAMVTLVFITLAPFIISLLTAGRYVDSTPYARIIALSTISSSIYFLVNDYSIATNRPKLYLYTSILGSILVVLCMPVVVNKWSYYGGAWMSVASYVMLAIINLFLLLV